MRPVAVLQFHRHDGAGFFAEHLHARGVPLHVVPLHAGAALPPELDAVAGLALLGGPCSVNDDLPVLRQTERLVAAAVAAGVPVIGHCLGGQLLASALGARVERSPHTEIGWFDVVAAASPSARDWLGDEERCTMFQWHYDAFSIPEGAELIAGNALVPHQAFVVADRHLGMQFHGEITPEKIEAWFDDGGRDELARGRGLPTVQTEERIRAQTPTALPSSRRVAGRLYDRWLQALRR